VQSGDDDNYESDDLEEGEGKLDAEGLRRLAEDQSTLLDDNGAGGAVLFNPPVLHKDACHSVLVTAILNLTRARLSAEIVTGKRKRQKVDYAALNAAMFGDFESYEGEGSDGNYED
jgi:hypothetical protein